VSLPCRSCGAAAREVRLPLDRATVALCPACGHGTTTRAPRRVDETSYGLADGDRELFATRYLPARQASYRRGLDLLGPPAGRSLLDVGSHYGDFLAMALADGWDAHGVELGAGLRRSLHEPLRSLVYGTFDAAAAGGPYDAVTLWDVLEHVDDPDGFLPRLARLLTPAGRVLVRVPDARVFDRLPPGPLKHLYLKLCHPTNPEEHVSHFTPDSLARMATRAGLHPIATIDATASERTYAGVNRVDSAVRRGGHALAHSLPYEFTALLEPDAPAAA
jgi:SAM-dependent methyltransferase